jgi:hypothetical protein
MLASHRDIVLFAADVSSVGARHVEDPPQEDRPKHAGSAMAPNQQNQTNAYFLFLVSLTQSPINSRRRLKPTLLNATSFRFAVAVRTAGLRPAHSTLLSEAQALLFTLRTEGPVRRCARDDLKCTTRSNRNP